VYDGTHDPVLVAQLLVLLQGRTVPQAQSATDTPDPSIMSHFTGVGFSTVVASTVVDDGQHGTAIVVETEEEAGPRGPSAGGVTIDVVRVLRPDPQDAHSDAAREARGHVVAEWRSDNGDQSRGPFAVLRDTVR
jgi:hypothetical protein